MQLAATEAQLMVTGTVSHMQGSIRRYHTEYILLHDGCHAETKVSLRVPSSFSILMTDVDTDRALHSLVGHGNLGGRARRVSMNENRLVPAHCT
ncbi:hypothetical protein BaRGS_00020526 [Batillaria attramentaria]|uniref:Uncharacterized protein n=1 Tax=Batillaria attramentaria TaxID=370345 RepID=A0ABD0KLZ5_9CAEN